MKYKLMVYLQEITFAVLLCLCLFPVKAALNLSSSVSTRRTEKCKNDTSGVVLIR